MKTVLKFIYTVWFWSVVLPFSFLIWTPLLWILLLFLIPLNRKLSVKLGVIWARVILAVALIRVKRRGLENIEPKQSYVIAVNHQSALDILALYGYLPIDFRWVMKIEIRKVPLIGSACDWMGHVYIDRSNREKAIQSLNSAKEVLVDGTSILFFPEGTRSSTEKMLPFKKGAFRMAIDLQLPILPVTLRNTGKLMPARGLNASPGTIELIVHPPIPVRGRSLDDLPKLMEQTRQIIQAGLDIKNFDDPINYRELYRNQRKEKSDNQTEKESA